MLGAVGLTSVQTELFGLEKIRDDDEKKVLVMFLLAISSTTFAQASQLSQLDGEWHKKDVYMIEMYPRI